MRQLTSRGGTEPNAAALAWALRRASGATISFGDDERGRCDQKALVDLASRLSIVRPKRPFAHIYERSARVVLAGADGSDVVVVNDGSLCRRDWTSCADTTQPQKVLGWFVDHGVPELLAGWELGHGPGSTARRRAWRRGMPKGLRWPWRKAFEQLADESFDSDGLRARLERKLGKESAIRALLRWYGFGDEPLSHRPGYEELPRRILSGFGFDPVVRAPVGAEDQSVLAGSARHLLGAAPLSEGLGEVVWGLPRDHHDRLIEAARTRFGERTAARLALELRPAPLQLPPGFDLVGRSRSSQFTQVVSDGEAVYALDGNEVVRLAHGESVVVTWQLDRSSPLAVVEGDVVVQRNGKALRMTGDGAEVTVADTSEFVAPRTSRPVSAWPHLDVISIPGGEAVIRRRESDVTAP